MDVRSLIIEKLQKNGNVRASEIVRDTGYSRTYVNRFFRELREEGVLTLIGKANRARYIPATEKRVTKERKAIKNVRKILLNKDLNEDEIFSDIRQNTGILCELAENVSVIIEYAFCEMLNNAIEHSCSDKITMKMERRSESIYFEIRDYGIGIYKNIKEKYDLDNEIDAIQDLTKGKLTTDPASHSGEGIFFTSKAGNTLVIQSSRMKLIFDNLINDIFVRNVKNTKGTRITFSISTDSTKKLNTVFDRYSDNHYNFSTTEVFIKLYDTKTNYLSRSQARRLLTGLEKYNTVILDFKGVSSVGQAFADEIFRVWQNKYPDITIASKNTLENVSFMINRALNHNQHTNGS
jgi:DNA-binding Lrp family transcriptional regulator